MIVITCLKLEEHRLKPGDIFSVSIADSLGQSWEIEEEITREQTIDYMASFRFACENGACLGFHLMGVFANSKCLPDEFKEAVMFDDLSEEQKRNFRQSIGIKI
jgi:hypothetical protein